MDTPGRTFSCTPAASLTNVVGDVLDACALDHSETTKVSFASSSVLAKQIDHGAPAAIFVSANAAWMNYLEKRDLLIPGSTPSRRRQHSWSWSCRHRRRWRTTCRPPTCWPVCPPTAGSPWATPTMFPPVSTPRPRWSISARGRPFASGRPGPPTSAPPLALVETGAAPLGIVYATDAMVSGGVRTVAVFPPESHPAHRLRSGACPGPPDARRSTVCSPALSAPMPHASLLDMDFLVPRTAGHADAR